MNQKSKCYKGFLDGVVVNNPPGNAEDMGSTLVQEDPTCCRTNQPMHHDN